MCDVIYRLNIFIDIQNCKKKCIRLIHFGYVCLYRDASILCCYFLLQLIFVSECENDVRALIF